MEKEDENLPVMALNLSGVALRFHIKVTVSRQASQKRREFPLNEVLERTP